MKNYMKPVHINVTFFVVIGAAIVLLWFFYGFYKMEINNPSTINGGLSATTSTSGSY